MATVVHEKTSSSLESSSSSVENKLLKIPPSVLLIGKKRSLDYIAPALFRINNTNELKIRATGSLSIVTAVDVAEMVKRDVENLDTKSITIGTDELVIATGEIKRMSCIEIHLIKVNSPIMTITPTTKAVSTVASTSPATEVINNIPAADPIIITEEPTTRTIGEGLAVAENIATKEKREKKPTTRTRKKSSTPSTAAAAEAATNTTTAVVKKKKSSTAAAASRKKNPAA